jgi:hypothetical protein
MLALAASLFAIEFAESEDFDECRGLQDDKARLACYDRVAGTGERLPRPIEGADTDPSIAEQPASIRLPDEATVSQPGSAAAAVNSDAVPMDDDVGRETLKGAERDDQKTVQGHVVRCHENVTGKYIFYFDNGQIWQQKDNARIPWRDCDFDVNIKKDIFGYKMNRVGEKKTVRIARVE